MQSPLVASDLLSRINSRRVLECLQSNGPLTRSAMARESGLSAPTISKAVASLIQEGLLEETEPDPAAFGRPAKMLQFSERTANVIGVVIDARSCSVEESRLDGRRSKATASTFPTPSTYEELLTEIVRQIETLVARNPQRNYRGVGVSAPGLLNAQQQRVISSPNLHLLDGRHLANDLSDRLILRSVVLQESHALCIGERMYGAARGLDNFAMLDVSTGLGLGVVSGGRLLRGHSGMAGELGHITVDPHGVLCGCGNRGCLETVATDSAFARRISEIAGRRLNTAQAIEHVAATPEKAREVIDSMCDSLAIAIAAVINIFNPSTLFVHGHWLSVEPTTYDVVLQKAKSRTLAPSFADCRILRAEGSKQLGAVAGIIQHLTDAWAPPLAALEADSSSLMPPRKTEF